MYILAEAGNYFVENLTLNANPNRILSITLVLFINFLDVYAVLKQAPILFVLDDLDLLSLNSCQSNVNMVICALGDIESICSHVCLFYRIDILFSSL